MPFTNGGGWMMGLGVEARKVGLILIGGLALRLLFMVLVGAFTQPVDMGEATHAALALARTGQIADAFFPGQGPTAHLMPAMIGIAGGVFRLLGPETAAANLTLAAWSLFQCFAGFLLLRAIFLRIGMDPAAVLGGLMILCLLPAYAPQETCDFRFWEGALSLCLVALNFLWLLHLEQLAAIGRKPLTIAAIGIALTFFVSPPAGLAIGACWGLFGARRLPPARLAWLIIVTALCTAALLAPWAWRNLRLLGYPIWLRSDFGLEIAIANHSAAVSGTIPATVLHDRMVAVHPFDNPQAAAALRASGGEVVYSRLLGRQTHDWIAAHPFDFLRLTARHYRQFYLPETWQFQWTNWHELIRTRAWVIQTVCLLGIIGLVRGLRRRHFYPTLALYIALVGLPYAVVQPVPRYTYLVYGLFAFLAAQLVTDVVRALKLHPLKPPRPTA
jgi:hypothetical protein